MGGWPRGPVLHAGPARRERSLSIPDNPNWHRHRNACPYYRERWTVEDEAGDEGCALLYQIFCLQNTPPITPEEQALCMKARTRCWRLEESATSGGQRTRHGAARDQASTARAAG